MRVIHQRRRMHRKARQAPLRPRPTAEQRREMDQYIEECENLRMRIMAAPGMHEVQKERAQNSLENMKNELENGKRYRIGAGKKSEIGIEMRYWEIMLQMADMHERMMRINEEPTGRNSRRG